MNFLESWQKKQAGDTNVSSISAKDKNVIVIGGGDTGCDCVATSLRQVNMENIEYVLSTKEITARAIFTGSQIGNRVRNYARTAV